MSQKPETSPILIFDWPRRLSSGGRLAAAMLLVLVGLTGFFYVFQVVYPQSQRFSPVPHEVFVLDAADPSTQALLHKVQDQDFLLLPTTQHSDSGVTLDAAAPVFHPSFADHQLLLKDLPQRTFTAPPARLLDRDSPVLPTLDLTDLKQSQNNDSENAESDSFAIGMKVSGIPPERMPKTFPELTEISLSEPESTSYEIAIDKEGRVIFALSLTSSEQPETLRSLGKKIRQLKFKPLASASSRDYQVSTLGQITFEWRRIP